MCVIFFRSIQRLRNIPGSPLGPFFGAVVVRSARVLRTAFMWTRPCSDGKKNARKQAVFSSFSRFFLYCLRTTDETCVEVQLTENGDDGIFQDGGAPSRRDLLRVRSNCSTRTRPLPLPLSFKADVRDGRAPCDLATAPG